MSAEIDTPQKENRAKLALTVERELARRKEIRRIRNVLLSLAEREEKIRNEAQAIRLEIFKLGQCLLDLTKD